MFTEIELFESPGLFKLNFCLLGWIKSEVYKRKLDTRDELLAQILNAAATCMKKPVGQLKQHAIFAHELQNSLRLTLGLLIICCGL
jgi:hypothetical protein